MALLEEEGGLDSIGITKAFDRAKVRGGVRRRISEVTVSKLAVTQTITHVVDQTTFASQLSSMFPTLAFLAPSVRYQGIWKRSNLTRHHPLVTLRQTQLRNSSHSHYRESFYLGQMCRWLCIPWLYATTSRLTVTAQLHP
jgi:hypothetical protein